MLLQKSLKKRVEKLEFVFFSICIFFQKKTAPHPNVSHQTLKQGGIIFSALEGNGGVKGWINEYPATLPETNMAPENKASQ